MPTPISVLILTKNEEQDLPGCLESISWCDDIHVLDSYSNDRTLEIANAAGAAISQRKFDGYASQRNAGLTTISYQYNWLLILDADERIPASLTDEMKDFVASAQPNVSACRIRRNDYFLGQRLAHAQISPFYIRLVQPSLVHYEREVNEVLKVNGKIVDLKNPFHHYPFSKGIKHWIDKHNVYSSMEANEVVKTRRGHTPFSLRLALLSKDFNERRFYQKEMFYRMPGRPFIKWCYMMFVRRAFLDGKAGFTYATLQAIYEYMIVLKTKEFEIQEKSIK